MADPALSHIDHGVESWDAIHNDNADILEANFMRSTHNAAHGQKTLVAHAEASSGAIPAAATFTFVGLIPAGCLLLGITTRVTTTVTGAATSIDTGDGTTVDQFGHHTALVTGTTTSLADHKAGGVPKLYVAAGDVVLTGVGGGFTGGVVRATAHYIQLTPPTS